MITRRKRREIEKVEEAEDHKLTKNPEPENNKNMSDKDKLEELHNLLVSMTDSFQEKFAEISSNFRKEIQQSRAELNDLVDKKMESMREEFVVQTDQTTKANEIDQNSNLPAKHIKNQKSEIKRLPYTDYSHPVSIRSEHLIALPHFDGKPMEWPGFISQYKRTTEIHNYDQVQNNIRLNEALTGDARKLVEPLLIHPKNVNQIIDDLEDRFGQPDLLIDEQLRNIRRFPNIADSQIHLIIDLADRVRNCKNFFESCDCSAYLDNPLLVKEISGKLPFNYRIEWIKIEASLKYKATITDLSKWLTETSQYLHRLSYERQHTLTNDSQEIQRQSYQKTKCDLCQESHSLENCQKFRDMDFNSRFQHARDARICFSCLKKGHPTKFCKNKKDCTVENCKHKHNILLHGDVSNSTNESQTFFDSARILQCNSSPGRTKILFQMIPIKIFGPNGCVETFAMFDSAADVSIMDVELANQLGIDGPEKKLNIQWLNNKVESFQSKIANINISGTFENAPVFNLQNVRLMTKINLPSQSLNKEEINARYNYLTHIPVDSYENAKPKLLLSLKEFRLTVTNKSSVYTEVGPIATKTKLGWMIYGPTEADNESNYANRICMTYEEDEDSQNLNEKVHKFINFDELVSNERTSTLSEEEKRSFQILENTTKKVKDRYESGLLWKRDDVTLPNNFSYAVKRFESIEKKMDKDSIFKNVYVNKINDYIEKGYATELSPDDAKITSSRTWYLPHFGVLNKNKPGKFRLVFDAAAKFQGTSLNSNLISGPDLNQSLVKVLFKFREKSVGVCGDIKEMFHQINIREEDQDSQRFIFRDTKEKPLKTFKMKAMTFGATCSPSIAQYIKNKNAEQYLKELPEAVEAIWHNHYVDDYVCSFSSESEATSITKDVVYIHKQAGFVLRGFISNSKTVAETLNSYQTISEEVSLDMGNNNPKILGLFWNLETDSFIYKTNMIKIDTEIKQFVRAPTKREVLSIVMSLFDPFGFIGNFTINGKLLLQSIWKQNTDWDQRISEDLFKIWKRWLNELPSIENLSIPRCYNNYLFNSLVQLHIFVDASSQAFAAVAYFRIVTENQTSTSLICSKTKCAPLKYMSIPRLELQAAVLGTRVMTNIIENQSIQIKEIFFWSDSATVLYWIRNEKRQCKPFVANRISQIKEVTNPEQWFKVSTKENVADQATRQSENVSYTVGNYDWLHGPKWLISGTWPAQSKITPEPESEKEIKSTNQVYTIKTTTIPSIIQFERFSNYSRLVRAIAWVFRFINNCRSNTKSNKTLSASEEHEAEIYICKLVQREALSSELESLQARIPLDKQSSIYNLNPIIDENLVIRVYGRIDNAPTIPLFTKQPIILPKNHYVTELIVRNIHNICKHQLQEVVICEIRKKFWINDIRSLVKKIKTTCTRCKILGAKPQTPLMGPHPEDRLTPFIRPFTYTGVDYFGPVSVSVGRSKQKRWVAIFTCLTIRAVHTEIAEDLSSDACIICIRNFINTRGIPKRMRSDNGTNFVGINNELMRADDIFEQDNVQDELCIRQIQWKFNVPSHPSAGGCWERMVQMLKRILVQSLKEVSPKVETLRSFLIEACNIINSRPLTHVPTNSMEEEPLTPNSFLLGDPNCVQVFSDKEQDKIWTLKKQWKIANHLKNHFWKRFVREYIPTLNQRRTNFEHTPQIRVGDIVLVADDNLTKNIWPRGIILELFVGKDGVARSALVKCRNKNIKRPTCKLAVIGNICHESKKFTIAVEGNIGSGKSTLLKSLSKLDNVEVFLEPIEKWKNCEGSNLLNQFYKNKKKYSYSFQKYVFETMREIHLKKSIKPIKIMERSLFSAGEIFTKQLVRSESITENQFNELTEAYKSIINRDKIKLDLIVYVKTSPEVSYSRIKSRGRMEETDISLEFIREIHDLHEVFINNIKMDKEIVDGNKNKLEVLEEIKNIILNLKTT